MSTIDLTAGDTGKSKRLLSVDALRGFDMLFITGGGTFIKQTSDTTYLLKII